jgi:hypothetical protein
MTITWVQGTASDVKVGDRVRTPGGELTVSRIEVPFMGMPEMLAFIEDTPERWYKQPLPLNTPVEVQTTVH